MGTELLLNGQMRDESLFEWFFWGSHGQMVIMICQIQAALDFASTLSVKIGSVKVLSLITETQSQGPRSADRRSRPSSLI